MPAAVPPYFDFLIDGFHRGDGGRFVHLGHWDEPPPAESVPQEGEFEAAQERLNEVLLELAELADHQAVLDVGCGFGGTIASINGRHRGMRLVGINVDPRQLDICSGIRPDNGNEIDWRPADACTLPFADGAFDRILCIEAMFHFASRGRFFGEAARVLRPGGVLVASDIVLSDSARRLDIPAADVAAALQVGFGPWPDPWAGDGDHRELAIEAGLGCDRIHDATMSTRPSHRFTVSASAGAGPPANPTERAAMMLQRLHVEGHLKYFYLRFSKA